MEKYQEIEETKKKHMGQCSPIKPLIGQNFLLKKYEDFIKELVIILDI